MIKSTRQTFVFDWPSLRRAQTIGRRFPACPSKLASEGWQPVEGHKADPSFETMNLRMCLKKHIYSLLFFTSAQLSAFNWHHVEPQQIKKGHFLLPTSQEIGPLYAFGQNIVDSGNKQLFMYGDALVGQNFHFTEVRPSFLYGITNYFSLFVELPIAAQFKFEDQNSAGVENITAQFEYALLDVNAIASSYQLTLVGNIAIPIANLGTHRPTGSSALVGSNSISYLLGTTACYMDINWYLFTCQGGIITTKKNSSKSGNSYLYQFGAARSIPNNWGWIFAGMLELFGQYSQKDIDCNIVDTNSGGNVIFIGPSLWASSPRFIGQIGLGIPIVQKLFGQQSKTTWFPAIDLGWKF